MKIIIAPKYLGLFVLILAAIFSCLVLAQSMGTSETDQRGLVTYVEGSAKKQKLTEVEWTNVQNNTQVASGERVRTFTQSRAELDLAQLDIIRMAPKTTIDILKLYEETKDQILETNISLQEGDLWANVKKKPENMSFSIGTPITAAAITGTTLRMNVDPDSSSQLRVYHGEVVITNAPQSSSVIPKSIEPYEIEGPHEVPGPHEVSMEEWALIVKSMQQVKIDKNGQVVSSGNFTATDPDENTAWVKWNLQRDRAAHR